MGNQRKQAGGTFFEKAAGCIRKHPIIMVIPEMLCASLCLPFCIMYFTGASSAAFDPAEALLLRLAFLSVGLMRVFRALGDRYLRPFPNMRRLDLAAGIVLVACFVILAADSRSAALQEWTCRLFWLILLAGRILSAAHNPRWSNLLVNIVLTALIVLYTLDLWNADTLWRGKASLVTLMAATGLLDILSYVFSRVRLDLLVKIIRKTYAAEILFSLMTLVLSFSWVLVLLEDGFHTYTDALWYCFAVVTTIGFGDYAVTTGLGRILSVILGIYGIVAVALITSIIVNLYGEMKKSDPEEAGLPESAGGDPESGTEPRKDS